MSMMLSCCNGCNTWHKTDGNEEYYRCENCGCETFTEEWILKHPEHPAYQKYLEYMKKEETNIEEYINRIIEVCSEAKPNQEMMFDNFGKYILHIKKDENFIEGTDNYNMVDIVIYEKNAVKREGKLKDLLVGDEVGIHVLDMYNVLKGIYDGTRKLSIL